MAGSLNKVLLIGRLGADPEIKQMVNGKNVARLSIATSQHGRISHGERKEKLNGIEQLYLTKVCECCPTIFKKGVNVYAEGQLSTRKWKDESTGQDKYSTEIVLQGYNSSLTMLDGRNKQENSNLVQEKKSNLPNDNLNQENTDLDDEIPF